MDRCLYSRIKLLIFIIFLGAICLSFSSKREEVFKQEEVDLNNNSIKEIYTLNNGRLTVVEDSKVIWQSPSEWWIDDFVIADSTNDGFLNLNLSLWKRGNYGSSKPFWVKENDMSIKNHFFVYNKDLKLIWGSSNLDKPNCEFIIKDIDEDLKNELVVIEGEYAKNRQCNGNYIAVWRWNGWGFSNERRSKEGSYSNLIDLY